MASLGGQGLLWYLRPRIQSICVNLYPSNPSAADDTLCSNILRDSLDPGALAVMISGSKLPPPRTANELLGANFGSSSSSSVSDAAIVEGRWSGPVLIAQGMKDPLNDAVGRAKMFQALREGIEIAPLDGGHCPHVSIKSYYGGMGSRTCALGPLCLLHFHALCFSPKITLLVLTTKLLTLTTHYLLLLLFCRMNFHVKLLRLFVTG